MKATEYVEHDAMALAALVRRRDISAEELLECATDQIERHNGTLNAVVHPLYERAARSIRAGLPEGPFTGVPLLLKDDLELEGTVMTVGSRFLQGRRCSRSHVVAERIEAAGFVIVGRTNMSELGLLPFTEPRAFGATRNPWELSHSPGGSSGGSAAAVAARLVPLAQASDGGGSIRIPASACGLIGLRPSRGRHSGMPDDNPDGFIVRGCLSRTVRDTAAFLDVISGNRAGDRWLLPEPTAAYASSLEGEAPRLRIAFATTAADGTAIDPDCRQAVEKTARLCESVGHHVEEGQPRIDLQRFNEAFVTLWGMCAGYYFARIRAGMRERLPAWLAGLTRNRLVFDLLARIAQEPSFSERPFEPFTCRLARIDRRNSPGDLWLAWSTMREVDRELARFFTHHDLFMGSVLGEPPWRIGVFEQDWSDETLRTRLFRYLGITHMVNTSGIPALSLPLHVNSEGLPIGTHVLAPWGQEHRLLALAAELERVAPWSAERPVP